MSPPTLTLTLTLIRIHILITLALELCWETTGESPHTVTGMCRQMMAPFQWQLKPAQFLMTLRICRRRRATTDRAAALRRVHDLWADLVSVVEGRHKQGGANAAVVESLCVAK